MKRSLIVNDELRFFLRRLPPNLKQKVKLALEEIVKDPAAGKALREELLGLSSYRIGKMRVVYRAEERSVTLITVGPRETVYQKAALEWRRQRR